MRHEPSTASGRGTRRSVARSAPRCTAGAVALLILAGGAACRDSRPTHPSAPVPATDFLLAAGDSTFWVTSGPEGVRVRGSPLLLAHYGGRFYEIYVADEDHSFSDAVFTTQRIYRRDLLTGDSDAVFHDSTVAMAAHGYAAAHPYEKPLGPDQDAGDDPSTSVTGEVDIVDVHGPYLSYEYHGSASAKRRNGGSADGHVVAGTERETVRRGVVDLRGARRATLRGLFGPAAADSTTVRGLRAFAAAVDSIRAARSAGDERASRAAEALESFIFDPLSFTLLDLGREPAVQFFARGTGAQGGLTLPLAPIRVSEASLAAWWAAERASFPQGGADSASDLWTRADVEIVARYDSSGGPNQGQGVVLLLRQARVGGAGVDTGRHEWRIGRFPAPTRRIYWLDAPPVDSATRRALVRAFDESALYGEDARSVSRTLPPARARSPRITFAALGTRSAPRAVNRSRRQPRARTS